MKILILACFNEKGNLFGGAEKTIINLANWLANNTENSVKLASIDGNAQPYNICKKVEYIGFNSVKGNKIKKHLNLIKYTKNVIKEYEPDVIISFWIQLLFYAVVSNKKKNIKFIFSERNDPNLEYGRYTKIMRKLILKKIDGFVFQTQNAMDYYGMKIKKRAIIIQNPVYIKYSDYELNEKMDNRIVNVGRLYSQKNQKMLIEAFYKIKDKYPEYTLEIYGEGELKDELKALIENKNMNDRVMLMGAYEDVIDKIYGARLFVLSSIYEGMPNALMEAMCLGIPVISSNCPCGGPGELIENEVNGYLFKNNDENSLIETIEKALKNNDIDLRKKEKEICNLNSQEIIFKKWEEFIEKCIKTEER